MVDVDSLTYLDDLIEEYLLFRGFTGTHKSVTTERKSDKLKGFQVRTLSSSKSLPLGCLLLREASGKLSQQVCPRLSKISCVFNYFQLLSIILFSICCSAEVSGHSAQKPIFQFFARDCSRPVAQNSLFATNAFLLVLMVLLFLQTRFKKLLPNFSIMYITIILMI